MLAVYLVCLIAGGVFVGLSLFGGHDHDGDAHGADGGHEIDHDIDHEVNHDVGHDLHVHDAHLGDAPGDAAGPESPDRRKPLWLPFTSFRFWTFGACFFGLTGVALYGLTELGEPVTALWSAGVGVFAGGLTSGLMHRLREPVGVPPDAGDFIGQVGELQLPLAPGGLSRVRVCPRRSSRARDLLVTMRDGRPLPKSTRVVILRFDDHGRALVAPETTLLTHKETVT